MLIKQADSSWTVGRVVFGSLVIAHGGALSGLFAQRNLGTDHRTRRRNCSVHLFGMKRNARLQKFATVLPDAIDLLGRALRAGHAVTAAIEMVAQ